MSAILAPIHTATLGKSSLRFFKSPSSRPELPWHVHDDLVACLGLPRHMRRQFQHMLANGPFKDDIRAVATGAGIVTIAPHYVAQGLIGAAIDAGGITSEFELEYAKAAVAAMKVLAGDLPPFASYGFFLEAAKNTLKGGDE
jgi:hypothetical protein